MDARCTYDKGPTRPTDGKFSIRTLILGRTELKELFMVLCMLAEVGRVKLDRTAMLSLACCDCKCRVSWSNNTHGRGNEMYVACQGNGIHFCPVCNY